MSKHLTCNVNVEKGFSVTQTALWFKFCAKNPSGEMDFKQDSL